MAKPEDVWTPVMYLIHEEEEMAEKIKKVPMECCGHFYWHKVNCPIALTLARMHLPVKRLLRE